MSTQCNLSKRTRTDTSELIGQLPDDLLCSVICRLKLKDVVKLSAVSRRWNNLSSSSLLELHFDSDNMFVTEVEHDFFGSSTSRNASNFVKRVNQFLEFYNGTQITSFGVTFGLAGEYQEEIDKWVRLAVGNGAERLSLDLSSLIMFILNREKYNFSKELFEGVKINLKHLYLSSCILGPNLTDQFSCLETLTLIDSPLNNYDLNSLFSCLVKLKELVIHRCALPHKLNLATLPLLTRFSVSSVFDEFELSNFNLLVITSSGSISFDSSGAPNLMELECVGKSKASLEGIFTRLRERSPLLNKLSVSSSCRFAAWLPKTVTVFSQVTILNIEFASLIDFSVSKMITLLNGFPSLCTFRLVTDCLEDENEEELGPVEFGPKHLTEAEIGGFYSTRKQMEFLVYLLKNSCALQRLVVKQGVNYLIPRRQWWHEVEYQVVYQQLQEFAKRGVLVIE